MSHPPIRSASRAARLRPILGASQRPDLDIAQGGLHVADIFRGGLAAAMAGLVFAGASVISGCGGRGYADANGAAPSAQARARNWEQFATPGDRTTSAR